MAIKQNKSVEIENFGNFHSIPPESTLRIAQQFVDDGWRKGLALSKFIETMNRHLNRLMAGDSSQDHPAAIAWAAACYMETKMQIEAGNLPKHLDDSFPPSPQYEEK